MTSFTARLLLLLLTLTTLVKVLDDDSDEHVENEEADEQQERDEVKQAPFIVVSSWLHNRTTYIQLNIGVTWQDKN